MIIKTIALLLIANLINAQSTIVGQVLDGETKKALAYVNIGVEGSSSGTVSDENGHFKIQVKTEAAILVVSYVGYQTETLNASTLKDDVQIALKPSPYVIDEIQIVSTNFDKELTLGAKNENGRGRSVGFGNAQLGTELGAIIRIEKETFVKSANFVLNHAKGDSLLLRINMYDYVDGKIGEKVLHHNVLIKDKQRKGTFTIDLQEYEILLDNDILLSVEWLRNFDESGNKLITFDTKKSRKSGGTFIRVSKVRDFIKLPYKKKYKPCIYLVGKQSSN